MFCCIHASRLLTECAGRFSPEVEKVDANTLVFDVSRLHRLYGSAQDIAQAVARHAHSFDSSANVAIASNPETAILTARNFPGTTVIPEDAADRLGPLDVENLPLGLELRETLESWGIGTFAELAKLPENGIAERLGLEGLYAQRLAKGAIERPLRIDRPQVSFGERVELEHPLSLLEPLLFVLARILNDQCALLQSHGMAANQVELTLELENRTKHQRVLRLPLPMRESKALLKLLQLDLEAHPPQAATVAIRLDLQPVVPRAAQNGLFLPVTPAPGKLEVTLARIRALVGSENAGVAELLNTHHPHPFRLVPRQPAADTRGKESSRANRPPQIAFRYFHPPLRAKVETDRRRPLRVAAPGVRGNILTYAGPWRTSGDWWTGGDAWDREEWDISLNDGGIYRMYREPDDLWFLEGVYD